MCGESTERSGSCSWDVMYEKRKRKKYTGAHSRGQCGCWESMTKLFQAVRIQKFTQHKLSHFKVAFSRCIGLYNHHLYLAPVALSHYFLFLPSLTLATSFSFCFCGFTFSGYFMLIESWTMYMTFVSVCPLNKIPLQSAGVGKQLQNHMKVAGDSQSSFCNPSLKI